MGTTLLEADFLTFSLKSFANAQPNNTDNDTKDTYNTKQGGAKEPAKLPPDTDWGSRLKQLLADNEKLNREARVDPYKIESKFFSEFFSSVWPDEACAKQLHTLGEPLKKVFKVLGFDAKVNPIYAFLKQPYVQRELLQTKLLNTNTFKALYKAVAARLVADSEFFKANNYNIIYCKDLYTKSVENMLGYLKLQSKLLPRSAKAYTADMQETNRLVFIDAMLQEKDPVKRALILKKRTLSGKKMRLQPMKVAKLNSIDLAETISDKLGSHRVGDEDTPAGRSQLNSKMQKSIADRLKTPAQILAAIQFLSVTTGSQAAKRALSSEKFGDVSTENLLKATITISSIMPKGELSIDEVDALVSTLLGKI